VRFGALNLDRAARRRQAERSSRCSRSSCTGCRRANVPLIRALREHAEHARAARWSGREAPARGEDAARVLDRCRGSHQQADARPHERARRCATSAARSRYAGRLSASSEPTLRTNSTAGRRLEDSRPARAEARARPEQLELSREHSELTVSSRSTSASASGARCRGRQGDGRRRRDEVVSRRRAQGGAREHGEARGDLQKALLPGTRTTSAISSSRSRRRRRRRVGVSPPTCPHVHALRRAAGLAGRDHLGEPLRLGGYKEVIAKIVGQGLLQAQVRVRRASRQRVPEPKRRPHPYLGMHRGRPSGSRCARRRRAESRRAAHRYLPRSGAAASTSQEPSPRSASPTCRPGSWSSARTRARSTRTARRRSACWRRHPRQAAAASSRPDCLDAQAPDRLGRPSERIRTYNFRRAASPTTHQTSRSTRSTASWTASSTS